MVWLDSEFVSSCESIVIADPEDFCAVCLAEALGMVMDVRASTISSNWSLNSGTGSDYKFRAPWL